MKKKTLIIAPHADDEVLGCGGFISKFNKKHIIHVLVMTNANRGDPKKYSDSTIKKIRKESIKAAKALNINKISFKEFPAPNLDQFPMSVIAESIYNYINKFNPDTVFIPDKTDLHFDHKVIFHASLIASRPVKKRFPKYIISYETLSETEWETEKFNPNFFVQLSEKNIRDKIKAFKQYKSQIKSSTHPRSTNGIINLAKYRGQFINSKYAESFRIIRGMI